jgi:hypothetical protein
MVTALYQTVFIAALATVLTGLEIVALRHEVRPGGLLDASIARPRRQYVLVRPLSLRLLPLVAGGETGLAITLLALIVTGVPRDGGISSTVAVDATAVLLALAVSAVTQLLPAGRDGADDMSMVVAITLAVAFVGRRDSAVLRAALGFLALQLCLCYATAGVSKLLGPRWRSGSALTGIMGTKSYGNPRVAALLRPRSRALVISWLVIVGEMGFPVAVLVGGPIGAAALLAGALFQVTLAFVMGLNRFVPWFLSCYPATFWTMAHYGVLS